MSDERLSLGLRPLAAGAGRRRRGAPLEHPVSTAHTAAEEEVDSFLPVLDHARDYVVSALWRWSDSPPLGEEMERLKAALTQRDGEDAAEAIARAHELIARYGDLESARMEGLNLDVITLVLDRAEALLGWSGRASSPDPRRGGGVSSPAARPSSPTGARRAPPGTSGAPGPSPSAP